MVGVFKLTRNAIRRKFIYNDYRKVFGGAGSLSVGNLFTWNVWYFGVDDSLSRQPENRKNYCLIVGKNQLMMWMIELVSLKKDLVQFSHYFKTQILMELTLQW